MIFQFKIISGGGRVSNPPSGFWLEKEPPHRNEPLRRNSEGPGGFEAFEPTGRDSEPSWRSSIPLGIWIRSRSDLEDQPGHYPDQVPLGEAANDNPVLSIPQRWSGLP
jgi:hypothetical protein